MNHIKLIITDLDSTLLHSNKSISQYSRDIFGSCSKHGIMTAIATARYRVNSDQFAKLIQPDFLITTEGALIHRNKELLYHCGFNLDTTNYLISELKKINHGQLISMATDQIVYWNNKKILENPDAYTAAYFDFSKPIDCSAYKVVTECPDTKTAEEIAATIPDCKVISYRDDKRCSFVHMNASKVNAVKALAAYLKLDMSEIAAFGDDSNDIEMIKYCGCGVAVSNAIDEVKAVAGYMTESNDEDGVAKFIERNFF